MGKSRSPGFLPLSSEYIFVFGEDSKKRLVKLGLPEKKIIITGSPQFDRYLYKKRISKKEKKIVFFPSSESSYNVLPEAHLTKKKERETFLMLFKALKEFPEYTLIIKGRLGWDMNNLPKIIAKEKCMRNVKFIIDADPSEVMANAEIVIVNVTTLVLDALLLKKPIISIWFKDMKKFCGYEDSNYIQTVYNSTQLKMAIKKNLNKIKEDSLKRKLYLKKQLAVFKEGSSKKISRIVKNLLTENNPGL